MEAYNELGSGYPEAIYQESLQIEFEKRKIPYTREAELNVFYKGIKLKKKYYADFICFENIIVEIKVVNCLINEHVSQVLKYLKTSDLQLALLVNFGSTSLNYKRVIL